VIHLEPSPVSQSRQRSGLLTWFIRTSIPAFSPFATESSSRFSNRFFSLTTGFKKSVRSM
jgi:hypothetical protein